MIKSVKSLSGAGLQSPPHCYYSPVGTQVWELSQEIKETLKVTFKSNVIKWGKQCNVWIFQFTNTLQTILQTKFKENNNNNNNMIIVITIIIIKSNNNIVTVVKIKLWLIFFVSKVAKYMEQPCKMMKNWYFQWRKHSGHYGKPLGPFVFQLNKTFVSMIEALMSNYYSNLNFY